jgi:hypothetical protein
LHDSVRTAGGSTREEFSFEREGHPGKVVVSVGSNSDPSAKGFPTCTAVVECQSEGYGAFFGWVQLVKSTDNSSGGAEFEIDPFFLFRDTPIPYCFFGHKPTLFDSPSRQRREPMKWLAHSFLAFTPTEPELFTDLKNRRVLCLLGFSWGFDIDMPGNLVIRPAERLSTLDWDSHLPSLRRSYPTWVFDKLTPQI